MLQSGNANENAAVAPEKGLEEETRFRKAQLIGHLVIIHLPNTGLNQRLGNVDARRIANHLDEVHGQDLRRGRGARLTQHDAFHSGLGLLDSRKVFRRGTQKVADVTEQSHIFLDHFGIGLDANLGQLNKRCVAREDADSVHGIQLVDRRTVFLEIVVFRVLIDDLQNPMAHHGMQEPHANGGDMAVAARLDGLQGLGDLNLPLEGFEESLGQDTEVEASSSDEDLCGARRCLDGRIVVRKVHVQELMEGRIQRTAFSPRQP